MDPSLPLDSRPLFGPDAPFTPALARAKGVRRPAIERALRQGTLRRLLRGVYVDAGTPSSTALRASALGLVAAPGSVAVGLTAAWVHGALAVEHSGPVMVVHPDRPGGGRHLAARDVEDLAGLRVTTPVRTALDVGGTSPPAVALACLDGLLRGGRLRHPELVVAVRSRDGWPGVRQLRRLVAMADGRAAGPAESVLRLHWCAADLPTPVPGHVVAGERCALALPTQRFGVVVTTAPRPQVVARDWTLLPLAEDRVLGGDPEELGRHLVLEFRRHLLRAAG